MKKAIALILLGMFLLSTAAVSQVMAAGPSPGIPYAEIDSVELGLGDKVTLGPYTITFVDTDPDFTKAKITLFDGAKSSEYILNDGETLYYPNKDNPTLVLSASVWSTNKKPTLYLDIKSPHKLIKEVNLTEGHYYSLPPVFPRIRIQLYKSTDTTAEFRVYLPYQTTPLTITIDEGSGKGVGYKLGDGYTYNYYMYLKVKESTDKSADFEVYLPKVASTNFKVIRKNGGGTNPSKPEQTVLIYTGLLYEGEKLPVKVGNTTYYVKLVSAIPDVARVDVLEGNHDLGNLLLTVGDVPKPVPNAPLKLSVQKVEPDYDRATIRVYAPENATVVPILRPANLVATIDALPKSVMLGDNIVVTINVKNLGRGDAYDVNVAAPIPDGFELVSMTKTWNLQNLPAFSSMPALIYVLRPTKVGQFTIGRAVVTFYDDQSLETGKKKTIYSGTLSGIKVYGLPELRAAALAYNGTWSNYVTAKVNQTVKVKFTVSAAKGNPNFEFVKNATLYLDLPEGLSGESAVNVGTIKAGESKSVQLDLKVTKEALSNVRASLVYFDPLGGKHVMDLGNVVTVDSIPPRVVVKTVKVWPSEDEIPAYLKELLSNSSDPEGFSRNVLGVISPYVTFDEVIKLANQSLSKGNSTENAKELYELATEYYQPSNGWKPLAIVLLLLTVILAGVAYKYWSDAEVLREKLERKKQRRPGGLPKKQEEAEESAEEKGQNL